MKAAFLIECEFRGNRVHKSEAMDKAVNLFQAKYGSRMLKTGLSEVNGDPLFYLWEFGCECRESEVMDIKDHAELCVRKFGFNAGYQEPLKRYRPATSKKWWQFWK